MQINAAIEKSNILLRWKAYTVSSGLSMSDCLEMACESYIAKIKSSTLTRRLPPHGEVIRVSLMIDRNLLVYIDKLASSMRANIIMAPETAKAQGLPSWRRMDYSWMICRIMDAWLLEQGFGALAADLDRCRSLVQDAFIQQRLGTLNAGRKIRLDNLLAEKASHNKFVQEQLQEKADALASGIPRDEKPDYVQK